MKIVALAELLGGLFGPGCKKVAIELVQQDKTTHYGRKDWGQVQAGDPTGKRE